jgi:hypothetical protein
MPISYTVDHEHRLVRVQGAGVFTDDDVFGYQREIMARQDVLGYDEIVDMTNVLRIALPSFERVKDLAKLSAEMDPKHPPGRFAIVAPGDVPFMLGRLYKGIRALIPGATREIGVFRTHDEAEEWLRRPRAGADADPSGAARGAPDGGEIR